MKVYIIKTTFTATVKGINQVIDEDVLCFVYTDFDKAQNAMKSLALKHKNNSGYTTSIYTNCVYLLSKRSNETDATYQIKIEVIEKEI